MCVCVCVCVCVCAVRISVEHLFAYHVHKKANECVCDGGVSGGVVTLSEVRVTQDCSRADSSSALSGRIRNDTCNSVLGANNVNNQHDMMA